MMHTGAVSMLVAESITMRMSHAPRSGRHAECSPSSGDGGDAACDEGGSGDGREHAGLVAMSVRVSVCVYALVLYA